MTSPTDARDIALLPSVDKLDPRATAWNPDRPNYGAETLERCERLLDGLLAGLGEKRP